MARVHSETETVIKKILPYLSRRGYDSVRDLDYETALVTQRLEKGFIDILVKPDGRKPAFLLEAKRASKSLTQSDVNQALKYGASSSISVPFVVVTNGIDIRSYNVTTGKLILWDGRRSDIIPAKDRLPDVLAQFRENPVADDISLGNDEALPYRNGLPLRQLNALFARCHNAIRNIEKSEESAFADFSKLLFLKLLEEKNDLEEDFAIPYSYRFYKLAETSETEADQVKVAIDSMIGSIISETQYGEVLSDSLKMRNAKTYLKVVKELASVSFHDCSLDTKGAAFEYYVRATMHGKKLGQYFTPREVVRLMVALAGKDKVVNAALSDTPIKVIDPACGTCGFLVYWMQHSLEELAVKESRREITHEQRDKCAMKVRRQSFFGIDANASVAAAAKMNMIIAGDGHSNISSEDSLSSNCELWGPTLSDADVVISNPPFGTSETLSLPSTDLDQFKANSYPMKGQYLFVQKMIVSCKPGGVICTVIDDGLLNTAAGKDLRKYLLQQCKVRAVISLPRETFKASKINVRSSILYMERREFPDTDLVDSYDIAFGVIDSLGLSGSGEFVRGFDSALQLEEFTEGVLDASLGRKRAGYHWSVEDIAASRVISDGEDSDIQQYRLDSRYWNMRNNLAEIDCKWEKSSCIAELNTIPTARGKSPQVDAYTDESEGYAVVIKTSSIHKDLGEVVLADADWIDKSLYLAFEESGRGVVRKGDVLFASTGDGSLGKACVYTSNVPAIADGHITIIRPNTKAVDAFYLADYLRKGFGNVQALGLYTGSTGMIEITPEQVDSIVVDLRGGVEEQKALSADLRKAEGKAFRLKEKARVEMAKTQQIIK